METTADKWRALLYALGIHLLCLGVMFVGLLWTHTTKPISVAGGVMEATLMMDVPAASNTKPTPPKKPVERQTAPKPQPKPAPKPEDAVEPPQVQPQAPIPNPDVVEREKAALLAQQQAEEKAKQEQEERQRQEQIELDEQKQRDAERKKRLAEQQAEQQKQLDDIRRRREEAEKRRKLEEERLAQLQNRVNENRSANPQPTQPPAEQPGNNGTDQSLLGRYTVAIQQAVLSNWLRPDSAQAGIRCTLRIVQIPGGEVIQVSVTSPCNVDDLTRRSIEAAVLKAQPLPYRGYESVFQRDIKFNFRYDG